MTIRKETVARALAMSSGRSTRWMSGCFALVLGIGAGNPSFVDSRYLLFKSARLPAPPADRATVYLVREQGAPLSPLPYERVYLDGEPAGLLPQRSWFLMHVEPGRHRFSGIMFCPDLIFECKPGRTYLLRMREVTDRQDRRSVDLLLDDAEAFRELTKKRRIAFVETTGRGMEYLRKRQGSEPDSAVSPRIEVRLHGLADTLSHILVEKPLDPVNLRRDFSKFTGRLILDHSTIRYHMNDSLRTSLTSWRLVDDFFDIPGERIVKVRFDGTRFAGVVPWINIVYHAPDGLRTVSFADARESEGVATYNRMFAFAKDLMERHRELARHVQADSARAEETVGTSSTKP